MLNQPIPTIFSAGWIVVLLIIFGYCVVRIASKARTIHDRTGLGSGPVSILGAAESPPAPKPSRENFSSRLTLSRDLCAQGKVDEALAECEAILGDPGLSGNRELHAQALMQKGLCLKAKAGTGDQGALLKAAEAFRQALVMANPAAFPQLHARIQAGLGETYMAQAGEGHRRERLLSAARAFYSGAQAAGDGAAALKADLFFKLGGVYEDLAGEAGEERALRRAAAACGEGIRCVSEPSEARARVLLLLRLANVSAKLGRKGHREDMERAAKAYRLALKELPREGEAYARTVAALAEAEKELGAKKEP